MKKKTDSTPTAGALGSTSRNGVRQCAWLLTLPGATPELRDAILDKANEHNATLAALGEAREPLKP